MSTRMLRTVAVGVTALSVSGVLFALVSGLQEISGDSVIGLGWPVANIVVGALLTYRRPHLLTGWLFAAIGLLSGVGGNLAGVSRAAQDPGAISSLAVVGGWVDTWFWIPLIYTTLLWLPLLFPNGRPPSPRWRWVTRGLLVTMVIATVLGALEGTIEVTVTAAAGGTRQMELPNPVGIPGLSDIEDGVTGAILFGATVFFLVAAFASVVVRFRRSTGTERQQLKWFTSAAIVLIVGFVTQGIVETITEERIGAIDITLFALPPIAAGVAVFRYRLYAIDRIISRTVTYALVTALLVGVYLALVTVLTAMTAPVTGDSPIAVAAATLAAAALFRPARRRIQEVVDRRFNRAQYDAARTVQEYRAQLRDELDLAAIAERMRTAADAAVQPAGSIVWLRTESSR